MDERKTQRGDVITELLNTLKVNRIEFCNLLGYSGRGGLNKWINEDNNSFRKNLVDYITKIKLPHTSVPHTKRMFPEAFGGEIKTVVPPSPTIVTKNATPLYSLDKRPIYPDVLISPPNKCGDDLLKIQESVERLRKLTSSTVPSPTAITNVSKNNLLATNLNTPASRTPIATDEKVVHTRSPRIGVNESIISGNEKSNDVNSINSRNNNNRVDSDISTLQIFKLWATLERMLIANFKIDGREEKWPERERHFTVIEKFSKSGSFNLGVFKIKVHSNPFHGVYVLKIVQTLVTQNEYRTIDNNTSVARSKQYLEYSIPSNISHPLLVPYVNRWTDMIREYPSLMQDFRSIENSLSLSNAKVLSTTSFLIMPYYDATLSSYFAKLLKSPASQTATFSKSFKVAYIIHQLMVALSHLQHNYVVHGDFRGENIFVKDLSSPPSPSPHLSSSHSSVDEDEDDEVGSAEERRDGLLRIGVGDFGVAKSNCQLFMIDKLHDVIQEKGTMCQYYLPPESQTWKFSNPMKKLVVKKTLWDFLGKADAWSCGIMILELFAGNLEETIPLKNVELKSEDVIRAKIESSSAPSVIKSILRLLLKINPEDRDISTALFYSGIVCWIIERPSHLFNISTLSHTKNLSTMIRDLINSKINEAQTFLRSQPYSKNLAKILEYRFFSEARLRESEIIEFLKVEALYPPSPHINLTRTYAAHIPTPPNNLISSNNSNNGGVRSTGGKSPRIEVQNPTIGGKSPRIGARTPIAQKGIHGSNDSGNSSTVHNSKGVKSPMIVGVLNVRTVGNQNGNKSGTKKNEQRKSEMSRKRKYEEVSSNRKRLRRNKQKLVSDSFIDDEDDDNDDDYDFDDEEYQEGDEDIDFDDEILIDDDEEEEDSDDYEVEEVVRKGNKRNSNVQNYYLRK